MFIFKKDQQQNIALSMCMYISTIIPSLLSNIILCYLVISIVNFCFESLIIFVDKSLIQFLIF